MSDYFAFSPLHSARDKRLYRFIVRQTLKLHDIEIHPYIVANTQLTEEGDLGNFNSATQFITIYAPPNPSPMMLAGICEHIAHEIIHWYLWKLGHNFGVWGTLPHYCLNTERHVSRVKKRSLIWWLFMGVRELTFTKFNYEGMLTDWVQIQQEIKLGKGKGRHPLYSV